MEQGNNTEVAQDAESVMIAKTIAEMHKLNWETSKFIQEERKAQQEAHKARHEGNLAEKKTKWFEFSLAIALIVATSALTKLYL